jgi:cytochrome c oxidase subunit 2
MIAGSAPALSSLFEPAAAATWAQNVLLPAGPQAAHILGLWNAMLITCSIALVLVTIGLLIAVFRRRHDSTPAAPVARSDTAENGTTYTVIAATVISVAGLLYLLVASVLTDRALARLPRGDALHIELTGLQWWWDALYDDVDPSRIFRTANELHIPVGRTVIITLRGGDVIHSFWVPNLHGKKDLIPGHIATIELRADRPGIYRGQCAEFCGYQHARMALLVIADPPDVYEQWAAQQRNPAAAPTAADAQRGHDVFLASTCAMCHTITGTTANAQRAPDLTHVAGRLTLAAATLDNTPANLAAWIVNPQQIKPGANMPPHALAPADLGALLAYLATLK